MINEVVFGTKHKKAEIVSPIFNKILNWNISAIEFDTDQLGTFSGEIPRLYTPRECALTKAKTAINLSGVPRAIASEGSIGLDPYLPFVVSNFELMLYLDLELEIQIVETILSQEISKIYLELNSRSDLELIFADLDLAEEAVIVGTMTESSKKFIKGINNFEKLYTAIRELRNVSNDQIIIVENDYRAMCSASRRRNIATCAEKLANRIKATCKNCGTPGWGLIRYLRDLPCESCGQINNSEISAEQHGCLKCEAKEILRKPRVRARAASCNWCNP